MKFKKYSIEPYKNIFFIYKHKINGSFCPSIEKECIGSENTLDDAERFLKEYKEKTEIRYYN